MTEQMSFSPEDAKRFNPSDFESAVQEERLPSTPDELKAAISDHQHKLDDLRSRVDRQDDNPNQDSLSTLRREIAVEEEFIRLYSNRLLPAKEESQKTEPLENDSPFADAHRALDEFRSQEK